VLRPATPPLTSLSTPELKTLVTGFVKMRIRWGKVSGPRCSKRFDENGLAAKGVIGMPGVREFRLLPGGKSLIVIDNRGGMTLRRITLEGGQASLPVVASVERDKRRTMGSWNRLLTAMSPCPILVHERATE
jgi:hypothetical protein